SRGTTSRVLVSRTERIFQRLQRHKLRATTFATCVWGNCRSSPRFGTGVSVHPESLLPHTDPVVRNKQGNTTMINETHLDDVPVPPPAIEKTGKSSEDRKRNRRGSHIVTILPRGEAIRNFVYTGVLDEISREAKVPLLSVVPNSDLESKMREHCHE